MPSHLHTCSRCQLAFSAQKHRKRDLSWLSIVTRPVKPFPLGDDIEAFDLVRCPDCGHVESASELRLFGVIPAKHVKVVLGVLLLLILVFGYWQIRTTYR